MTQNAKFSSSIFILRFLFVCLSYLKLCWSHNDLKITRLFKKRLRIKMPSILFQGKIIKLQFVGLTSFNCNNIVNEVFFYLFP